MRRGIPHSRGGLEALPLVSGEVERVREQAQRLALRTPPLAARAANSSCVSPAAIRN